MEIVPLGDSALLVRLGDGINESTHARVRAATQAIEAARLPAVAEVVPAYTTVTVYYNPLLAVAAGAPDSGIAGWLGARVRSQLDRLPSRPSVPPGRDWEVPVCYDEAFAPDLAEVAQATGLERDEVIRRHAAAEYLVYLIGFAPGFPYMGGLPPALARPRRSDPRPKVAAGSVGIVGAQCCIYPVETPAGWNIIGRTPLRLYRPEAERPALFQAGDRVRFQPVTPEQFENWRET